MRQQNILLALQRNRVPEGVPSVAASSPMRISVRSEPKIFAAFRRGSISSARDDSSVVDVTSVPRPLRTKTGRCSGQDYSSVVDMTAVFSPVQAKTGHNRKQVVGQSCTKVQLLGRTVPVRRCGVAGKAPRTRTIIRRKGRSVRLGAHSRSKPQSSGEQLHSVDDTTRDKVATMLARVFAPAFEEQFATGSAERPWDNVALGRRIEVELFTAVGLDVKAYRRTARCFLFNLKNRDGVLLRRVLAGEVATVELVNFGPDDLASDHLKAQRQELRAKHFREEIHLLHGPPKRRRDLLRRRQSLGESMNEALDGTRNVDALGSELAS